MRNQEQLQIQNQGQNKVKLKGECCRFIQTSSNSKPNNSKLKTQ